MAIIVESPIAESKEYRPPTQSQNPNILFESMPNFSTSSLFVDTATKCFATDFSSPPRPLSSQDLAARAFVIVSRVVKVFEETTKRVSDGLRPLTASAKSVLSIFETNLNWRLRSL